LTKLVELAPNFMQLEGSLGGVVILYNTTVEMFGEPLMLDWTIIIPGEKKLVWAAKLTLHDPLYISGVEDVTFVNVTRPLEPH